MTKQRVQALIQRMEECLAPTGRTLEDITLLVVTKNRSLTEIQEMYDLGFRHFAENRPEILQERQKAFPQEDMHWHLIGSLQRRKIGLIDGKVEYFHALDREKLIQALEDRLQAPLKVFLQVNVSGEASKHGFEPGQVAQAFNKVLQAKRLQLVGLMTMAPFEASQAEIRKVFSGLASLAQDLKEYYNLDDDLALSMGMSNDFDIALEEGANYLRIGTAWFQEEENHHGIIG